MLVARRRARRARRRAGCAAPTPIARGEYLVRLRRCNDCHTPWKMGPKGPEPDMTRALTGHPADLAMPPRAGAAAGPWICIASATNTAWAGPWGVSFTANLTPDKETGLGDWTEEMFIATMRTGRHQGKGRADSAADAVLQRGRADRRRPQGGVRLPAVAAAGAQPRAAPIDPPEGQQAVRRVGLGWHGRHDDQDAGSAWP